MHTRESGPPEPRLVARTTRSGHGRVPTSTSARPASHGAADTRGDAARAASTILNFYTCTCTPITIAACTSLARADDGASGIRDTNPVVGVVPIGATGFSILTSN